MGKTVGDFGSSLKKGVVETLSGGANSDRITAEAKGVGLDADIAARGNDQALIKLAGEQAEKREAQLGKSGSPDKAEAERLQRMTQAAKSGGKLTPEQRTQLVKDIKVTANMSASRELTGVNDTLKTAENTATAAETGLKVAQKGVKIAGVAVATTITAPAGGVGGTLANSAFELIEQGGDRLSMAAAGVDNGPREKSAITKAVMGEQVTKTDILKLGIDVVADAVGAKYVPKVQGIVTNAVEQQLEKMAAKTALNGAEKALVNGAEKAVVKGAENTLVETGKEIGTELAGSAVKHGAGGIAGDAVHVVAAGVEALATKGLKAVLPKALGKLAGLTTSKAIGEGKTVAESELTTEKPAPVKTLVARIKETANNVLAKLGVMTSIGTMAVTGSMATAATPESKAPDSPAQEPKPIAAQQPNQPTPTPVPTPKPASQAPTTAPTATPQPTAAPAQAPASQAAPKQAQTPVTTKETQNMDAAIEKLVETTNTAVVKRAGALGVKLENNEQAILKQAMVQAAEKTLQENPELAAKMASKDPNIAQPAKREFATAISDKMDNNQIISDLLAQKTSFPGMAKAEARSILIKTAQTVDFSAQGPQKPSPAEKPAPAPASAEQPIDKIRILLEEQSKLIQEYVAKKNEIIRLEAQAKATPPTAKPEDVTKAKERLDNRMKEVTPRLQDIKKELAPQIDKAIAQAPAGSPLSQGLTKLKEATTNAPTTATEIDADIAKKVPAETSAGQTKPRTELPSTGIPAIDEILKIFQLILEMLGGQQQAPAAEKPAAGTTPPNADAAPAKDTPAPAKADAAPAKDTPAPAKADAAPAKDTPAPAKADAAPATPDAPAKRQPMMPQTLASNGMDPNDPDAIDMAELIADRLRSERPGNTEPDNKAAAQNGLAEVRAEQVQKAGGENLDTVKYVMDDALNKEMEKKLEREVTKEVKLDQPNLDPVAAQPAKVKNDVAKIMEDVKGDPEKLKTAVKDAQARVSAKMDAKLKTEVTKEVERKNPTMGKDQQAKLVNEEIAKIKTEVKGRPVEQREPVLLGTINKMERENRAAEGLPQRGTRPPVEQPTKQPPASGARQDAQPAPPKPEMKPAAAQPQQDPAAQARLDQLQANIERIAAKRALLAAVKQELTVKNGVPPTGREVVAKFNEELRKAGKGGKPATAEQIRTQVAQVKAETRAIGQGDLKTVVEDIGKIAMDNLKLKEDMAKGDTTAVIADVAQLNKDQDKLKSDLPKVDMAKAMAAVKNLVKEGLLKTEHLSHINPDKTVVLANASARDNRAAPATGGGGGAEGPAKS